MCNVYHYLAKLPDGINGFAMPCDDGFSIYTDYRLDSWSLKKTLCHELNHIIFCDFEKDTVGTIELDCHSRSEKPLEYYQGVFENRLFHCGYVNLPSN